jgi:hypothetical protein
VRTYEFEFRSSSAEGADAFFNHMLVQPDFSAVVLGNTKKQQVWGLCIATMMQRQPPCGKQTAGKPIQDAIKPCGNNEWA